MIPKGWKQFKLDEIANITSGGTPNRAEEEYWGGQIPWVTTSLINFNRITASDEYITDKGLNNSSARIYPVGTILLAMYGQGETRGRVAILDIEAATNQACAGIQVDSSVNIIFIYQLLVSKYNSLRKLSQGSHQDNLSGTLLKSFRIVLPAFSEQCKIADILSTWDNAIDLVGKQIDAKQQLKKGLMQQLLSGKVRFSEFGEPAIGDEIPKGWHTEKLKDVFKLVKRKNSKGLKRVLTASGEYGLIDQIEFFNKSVAGKDLSGYYLLKQGEFAYNRSAMNGYPYGAIKRLDRYEEGVLSTLYICFAFKKEVKVNSDFYAYYFEAGCLNRQLRMITQVGGRAHGLLNITNTDFENVQLVVPGLEEQKRIAEVLSTIDREIDLLKQHEVKLRKQKQGLMQKLLTGEVRVKV